ncbi:regulator of Vps4 activity in the MVB pathway-domain-containing protein [Cerioporus squamosus]|nr:regulator of Vps4 activity in the MVB pathway-domain-containing protein [Cerioporus squamosus]
MVPWNAAKAKVQLRLGVQRLRTLQEKKNAQAKAARRDIAMLLEKGRIETARIKTENIINEDVYVELLELLELYCELLIARFGLLDQSTREPDPGVSEGVCAIIYAAPRTELKELHLLRDILMHKFGREFSLAVMENRDGCVSERVTRKLDVSTPPDALVDAYLSEIAKGYGVAWSPPQRDGTDDGQDDGPEGGVKVKEAADRKAAQGEPASPRPLDAVAISAEARSAGVRTPKLPELPAEEEAPPARSEKTAATPKPAPSADPPKKSEEEDEFDVLAKRFEALKKR